MAYREVNGDLITLTREGMFDVITHGCNCFNVMGSGLAPKMAKEFRCNEFKMEQEKAGDYNKLGQIDYEKLYWEDNKRWTKYPDEDGQWAKHHTYVVNSYSQYNYNAKTNPLDYEALTLCLRKINHIFRGKHIGLPKIGAGLAGGDWERIRTIIKTELVDCEITVVIYG
jgi:O-acetyl-ADP-ribose deacetylase (regulator of RNase III)